MRFRVPKFSGVGLYSPWLQAYSAPFDMPEIPFRRSGSAHNEGHSVGAVSGARLTRWPSRAHSPTRGLHLGRAASWRGVGFLLRSSCASDTAACVRLTGYTINLRDLSEQRAGF